jgi:methionyl-tRNA formyltransferase
MMKKEDGAINWLESAESIDRHVRAYDPWPGTYTHWNGQMLKIVSGKTISGAAETPGKVLRLSDGTIAVGTGNGLYAPSSVQLAGRPAVAVSAFVNGHSTFVGSVLGSETP